MKNRTFEDFDFTDFWDDDEYAKNGYIGEFPTEEMIEEVERELGYKLPESYIWLMKQHNGGIPFNVCFPCDEPTSWADDHVAITGIMGMDKDKMYSLCGQLGSRFMIEEWGSIRRMIIISLCWPITLKILFVDLSTKKCLIRWKKMKGKSWKKFVPQLSRHFCLIYARSVIIPSIRNDGFVKYRKKS